MVKLHAKSQNGMIDKGKQLVTIVHYFYVLINGLCPYLFRYN